MTKTGEGLRFSGTLLGLAVFSYCLLIAYGSLFPFSDWRVPAGSPFDFVREGLSGSYSQADLVVNILAYVPLGGLLFVWMVRAVPQLLAFVLAVAFGSGLSFGMETVQAFLPFRVSSLADFLVNVIGTALGAGIGWLFSLRAGPAAIIYRMHAALLRPGALPETGFWVACLAMLMLVGGVSPSIEGVSGRQASVLPLWAAMVDTSGLTPTAVLEYVLQVLGVLVLWAMCLRRDRAPLPILVTLVALMMVLKFAVAVLFIKVPMHAWMVSAKALLGLSLALAAMPFLMRHRLVALVAGVTAFVAAYLMAQLATGSSTTSDSAMNWVPFGGGHMLGSTGIFGVAEGLVRFLALGCLVNLAIAGRGRAVAALLGGLGVFGLAFATEWMQQQIPGRHADITDVLLAVGGWFAAWLWRAAPASGPMNTNPTPGDAGRGRAAARRKGSGGLRRTGPRLVLGLVVSVLVSLAVFFMTRPVEIPLQRASLVQHPDPADLAPVILPGFRSAHPRLPAPTAGEIATLRDQNPEYINQHRRFARDGSGRVESLIFLAFIEPGSQDMDQLFEKLMSIRFHYRGNGTETVVVGYDWLYDQWSERQRAQLRERLFEGFDFTYAVIRDQRLSPYNVYWYNSPFQRLLALGLVLNGPDERGDAAMRVVHHLLKTEMLPVWRQVMGRNGGWHEGGEYVGIGIGQAVYRVPAMWRNATGEDLFASETYLRGFLDFLVFRVRPDGTHFRWGDGRFFDRAVPDQRALALEYGHAAAFHAAQGRVRPYTPTSWPWGPLADPVLQAEGEGAVRELPLSRLFDGIGLMVARSDWTEDATYVTFKAGDNFWSHTHLDQGAFTIFKGGPLAIDSGLYGPSYGSDHHMNYSYQTIAHNTITVTDPDDNVPVVNRHGARRSFANDGGQRRIGSGWGVESAPMNRAEWEFRREVYHTGSIEAYYEDETLTVAVADITPAYTNAWSGKGTFSHRTRRVERAWRVFAYDRLDDVVIVHDQVVATDPAFRKRWLLHVMEPPALGERRFTVHTMPMSAPGRAGGRLEGEVLYPEDAQLLAIGGPGFEFFVDGVNYDDDGKVSAAWEKVGDPEPGSWRIEIMPGRDRWEDQFLVVMLPALIDAQPRPHRVTRLAAGGRIGAEVAGPQRTTRWWFQPGINGVEIEIDGAEGARTIYVGRR